MLTRLKVSGFKNLVDVDVRFGPFTCIAGANGVGKSNLFDAIHFLSALADRPLIDAALFVRDEAGRTADIRSIFHRVGVEYVDEMSFEAEMIVPEEGWDDLGQRAKASTTFLRYSVVIAYRRNHAARPFGSLELMKEELVHITQTEAWRHLPFPHSATPWRRSAVKGRRSGGSFISTDGTGANRVIKLHQDGGSSGRPLSRSAANLPRTVLSVANAAESPTALMARREMQAWRLLQLEPSALRRPDEFTAPTRLGPDGSHLAATLYQLARFHRLPQEEEATDEVETEQIYSQVANRLAGLIEDVQSVHVDRDERRELLTIQVAGRDGTIHPARALSDGTLRFLALAVIALDPTQQGVLCLEEPENGIHPQRIPAILELLQDIATDVTEAVSVENPLRQVIINTHSPVVVGEVPEDSLLIAELKESLRNGLRFKRVCFSCLPGTWRDRPDEGISAVKKGDLIAYLNPVRRGPLEADGNGGLHLTRAPQRTPSRARRVVDRPDLQGLLPLGSD